MPKLSIHTMVAALGGTVFLAACPGDDSPSVETDAETETTTTSTVPTTMPPTTTPPPDGTTTMGDDVTTTMSVDDTATTGDETTGTTGGTTDGTTEGGSESSTGGTTDGTTTMGGATTTEGGSESSTGEPPAATGYGDCVNEDELVACLPDEICLGAGNVGVCAEQGCVTAGDCAVPTTGNAVVTCASISVPDTDNDCFLDCSMGETCPDGMVCYPAAGLCVWEIMPTGGGICPDVDIGSTVPQTVIGDNTGLGDEWAPSCGGNGDDATYQFTATAAGNYVFDTAGSAFDTVLAVLQSCAGPELACNDDAGGGTSSLVTVPLMAGQTVIVVVDGWAGATGALELNVSMLVPGLCPDQDLGSTVPQTVMGTNAGLGDDWITSCGGGGGDDALLSFTAPVADTYVFDTQGSTYDTVLAVLEDCDGPELGCNDDAVGATSQVIVDLVAGQTVTIVVDGYAGSTGAYTLNVGTM